MENFGEFLKNQEIDLENVEFEALEDALGRYADMLTDRAKLIEAEDDKKPVANGMDDIMTQFAVPSSDESKESITNIIGDFEDDILEAITPEGKAYVDELERKYGISASKQPVQNEDDIMAQFFADEPEKSVASNEPEKFATDDIMEQFTYHASIKELVKEKMELLDAKGLSFKERIDRAREVDKIDDEIGSLLNELYKVNKESYSEVVKAVLPHLSKDCVNDVVKNLADSAKTALSEMTEGAKTSISEKVSGAVTQIRESIGGAIKDARERLDEVKSTSHELLDNVKYDAKFRLDSGKERVIDVFASAVQKIGEISDKSHNNINSIKSSVDNMLTHLNEKFRETGKVAGEIIQECREDIMKFGRFAFEADLVEAAKGIISRFEETTRRYTNEVISAFKTGVEAKMAAIAAFGEKVENKVTEVGNKFEHIKETTGEKITSLKDKLETQLLINAVKNEITLHKVEAACEKNFSNLISSVHEEVKAVKSDVDKHAHDVVKKLENIGEKIKSGISKAGDAIDKIEKGVVEAVDKVDTYVHDSSHYNHQIKILNSRLAATEKKLDSIERIIEDTEKNGGNAESLYKAQHDIAKEKAALSLDKDTFLEKKEQLRADIFRREPAPEKSSSVAEAASKPSLFQRLKEKVSEIAHKVSERISAVLKPHKDPVVENKDDIKGNIKPVGTVIQESSNKDRFAMKNSIVIEAPPVNIKPLEIVMSTNKDWNEYNPHEKNKVEITQTAKSNSEARQNQNKSNGNKHKQVAMEM